MYDLKYFKASQSKISEMINIIFDLPKSSSILSYLKNKDKVQESAVEFVKNAKTSNVITSKTF